MVHKYNGIITKVYEFYYFYFCWIISQNDEYFHIFTQKYQIPVTISPIQIEPIILFSLYLLKKILLSVAVKEYTKKSFWDS